MGRNVNIGLSSSELLRLYTQVSKTPLGASATATASFDPLTFGSLTSQSIYSESPNAFLSASLNSSLSSFSLNDISASSLRNITEIYSSSIEGGIPERIVAYTSSIDARESKYIVWDTINEIFYEFTQPTIEYILSTAAREARYPSPVYTNYVRPETYLVKVPINSTISDFITTLDSTFQTDVSASLISASLATTYTTKLTLTGSVENGGWNDESASAAGVPINGLYYTTGNSIRVRLS
jgi:hypothetical protein